MFQVEFNKMFTLETSKSNIDNNSSSRPVVVPSGPTPKKSFRSFWKSIVEKMWELETFNFIHPVMKGE